jgi:uncharacterized protein HemX
MAEARLKEGRKRLADVILELQASPTFDKTALQQRLEQVGNVFLHLIMRPRVIHERYHILIREGSIL